MKRFSSLLATPAARVAAFRVAFGVLMCIELARYLAFGWVTDYWVTPTFHFTYYGFDWVTPWPGAGMYLHVAGLIVASALLAAGVWYRAAAAVFAVGFGYLFLLDQTPYLNHFYLIELFAILLAVLPSGAGEDVHPTWALRLLQFQLAVVYVFGGLAKLNADWLAGQPLTMWLQANDALPAFMHADAVGLAMSWGGLAVDLLIVPALLWRRTRLVGLVVVTAFHLVNAWIFSIGIFPWFSVTATWILFWPGPMKVAEDGARPGRVARLLIGVWVLLQVIVPLRHWAYPADVAWTDEGHRFAWRMKLRSKTTTGRFYVVLPDGERVRVDERDHLTALQADKMRTRPDMILQYAHLLCDENANRGDVEVRAHLFTSLNGRQQQRFIDPEVDLCREARTLQHVRWVVPREAEAHDEEQP